jgi:enamine deaminase RidA (YjgF/YER057c/UK114 family)
LRHPCAAPGAKVFASFFKKKRFLASDQPALTMLHNTIQYAARNLSPMIEHDGILTRSFDRPGSSGSEHFITVQPPAELSLDQQIDCIQQRYDMAQHRLALPAGSAVCRRLFVSDAMNQAAMLRETFGNDSDGSPVALSIIQQPPLSRAKVELLAYHADGGSDAAKQRLSGHDLLIERNGLKHVWSTGLCAGATTGPSDAHAQTRKVFGDLIGTLRGLGGTLSANCLRTWLYMKGVDVFYGGMVTARRELFADEGLSPETHFIASTGIEGACAHQFDVVAMDAYSIIGLEPAQISYLNDFDRLCPTADYNVTFERGTRIAYADRAHMLISGTASIDSAGQVVHVGDVLSQLDRTMENVDALLRAGGAGLDALMHLIVYLRDPSDYTAVREALASRYPGLPANIVQGAVCRPEWLIEVEGVAIAANDAPGLPRF